MNKTFEILGFLVVVLVIGLGLEYQPQLSGLWSILAILVITVSGRQGPGFLAVITLFMVAVAVLLLQHASPGFILLSILPGCAAGYLVTRWFSLGKVLAGGFAAGVIGFGLFWAYQFYLQASQLSMHAIETAFVNYFNHIFLPTLEASGLDEYYAAHGLTQPVIKEYFDNFLESLAVLRPSLYVLESWVRILLGIVLGRMMLRSRGLLESPPFIMHRMAWQLDWLIIAGLALWLAGAHWDIKLVNDIGANIIFLMAPIAFYFGVSLTLYFIRHWRIRPWLLVVMALVMLFLPTQACLFITVLGVFDPLIDYRNLDGKRGSPA
ncbi:MAG: DUF2232 domain-containing protein [Syntrophomonadales bacterium]